MFRNYFKIAWRNLFRNKGFAITNLLGLTVGMTCTILILLWVRDEVTYDQFHANYKNIYQVIAHRDFNNQVFTDRNMVFPLAKAVESSSPQIKNAVVTSYNESHVLTYGDTRLRKTGYMVSEHYFDMFSWSFIKGNATSAISDPSSIVLTQSAAKALFGDADPINKIVRMDNEQNLKVTAILADLPGNSTFQFDFIKPWNYDAPYLQRAMNEWSNSSWTVFVQTVPGADLALIDKNINAIKSQHDPNDHISSYFSFPMNKWRLYSDFKDGKNVGGMIEYIRLFSIIAVIILLIACINFMNLSTARSERRAKEVGIRKTLGSDKKQLILQFFFESIILAFIALAFSLIAVYLLLPSFNTLVNKQLHIDLAQPLFWLTALSIVVLTGVIAGSYPALYLSSFNPVSVLKGTFLGGKKAVLPRQMLVVAQFVISILLISATIIVYQQIQHVRGRDIGYDPNNLMMISSTPDIDKNYAVIKQELLKTGLVDGVTRTGAPITGIQWRSGAPDWKGKPANASIIVGAMAADADFTKTLGIKILEGRDFSGTIADSLSMLLNKAAVETMGLQNPVGMAMNYGGRNYTVIGITGNVISESPFNPVNPMLLFYQPGNVSNVNIRLKKEALLATTLPSIETIFKTYNPAFPFESRFVDQEFDKKFLTEKLISKITNIFAGLAIFICCIGLAGLASFTIEKRIREIGIRKVLGATVQQVLMLLSKEFLRLVLIAFLIAVPLTWWAMSSWLQNYTYHIEISIWLFVAVGVIVLLLTLIVVCLNTIRVALANPVKSLRAE